MRSRIADTVYFNGRILTIDSKFTIANSMAVSDGQFLSVCKSESELHRVDDYTKYVDLGGRTVIPGLIDTHAHMDREGLKKVYPPLRGVSSIRDILAKIDALVRAAKPGEWIVTMPIGEPPHYWDGPEILEERRWPCRWDLDEVAPDNPVYIRPIWGFWRHKLPLVSIANSRALEECGIDRNTASPAPSVVIERDETDEPTGVFVESTYMSIVELTLLRKAGGFTAKDRIDALGRSMSTYNSFGTTGVFEGHGVSGEVVSAYRTLRERGPLSVRANLLHSPSWRSVSGRSPAHHLETWGAWLAGRGLGDDYLRVGGLYALLENENEGPRSPLENRLRSSAGAYTGWAGFYYDAGLPRAMLKEVLVAAARNDIRCCGLTIDLLDLYEEVDRIAPIAGKRWILAHLDVMNPDQIARARDLGLLVTTHTNRIWRAGRKLLAGSPTRPTTICRRSQA